MIFAPPSDPPAPTNPAVAATSPTPSATPAPTVRLGPLHGLIGAQVRYVARLARGMDPRLGLGELVWLTSTGSSSLTARVTFDEGGECRARGQLVDTPSGAVAPASGTADGMSCTEVALACLGIVRELPGLAWGALVRADRTVVASVGEPPLAALPDVAVRAFGILGGLEEHHREECVRLVFDHRDVVVAPAGAACVVLCLESDDPAGELSAPLRRTLEVVRRSVAAVDLDRVPPLDSPLPSAPTPPEERTDGEETDEWDDEEEWDEPPLIGARFAGATGARTTRPRRRGRGGRRGRPVLPGPAGSRSR